MKISKGLIASVIIITISGLAFATGFFKENVISKIEDIKVSIAEDEILVDRMDAKISDILIQDQIYLMEAANLLVTAKMNAIKLYYTNSTINQTERIVLGVTIGGSLNTAETYTRECNIGQIATHFFRESNESDYYLATNEIDGFDFVITKEEIFDFNASNWLFWNLNSREFTTSWLSPTGPLTLQFRNTLLVNLNLWNAQFTRLHGLSAWTVFLREYLQEVQIHITANSEILSGLESQASFYNYGVTIITVATILATAMAAKLSDNEREMEFSEIKAEIFDDKSMHIKEPNKLALPILIIALIISILGLIFPILYGILF